MRHSRTAIRVEIGPESMLRRISIPIFAADNLTMTPTKDPIVLLEPEPSDRLQITAFFERKGYRVIAVDPPVDRPADFTALSPVLALINGYATGAADIIEQARASFPEAVLMVMGSAEQMPRLFDRFRNRADDCITKPITPLTLDATSQ